MMMNAFFYLIASEMPIQGAPRFRDKSRLSLSVPVRAPLCILYLSA